MVGAASVLQYVWSPIGRTVTVGVGFTVMVKVDANPVQTTPALVKEGVTVMVAVTGEAEILVAAKEAMLPVPLAASPMVVLELTQL